MRVLSPEFPRYLSHKINIASHAQCPEHDHRDVYGWTARNLQREPCISHDGRGKIAKLVVAWWSHGVSKPKKPTQDAPAGDVDMVDQGAAAPDPQVPTGVSLSKAQNESLAKMTGSRPGSRITYGSARA